MHNSAVWAETERATFDEQPSVQNEMERLRREHGELKARLSELNSRLYLSPDEEFERKTIQKLKLLKKDQLAALQVRYTGNS